MPAEAPSLVPLSRGQLATARHLLPPERPGPMIAQHLLGTGNGSCLADRWPAPRALLVETGGNWTLAGDPGTLDPATVAGRVAGRAGLRDGLDRQHLGRPRGAGRQRHRLGRVL